MTYDLLWRKIKVTFNSKMAPEAVEKGMLEAEVKDTLLESEVKEKEDEAANDMNFGQPVDTGWAWVINVCIFLNISGIVGYSRCLSVLFIDLMEEFDQSAMVVSLTFTFISLFGSATSILASTFLMTRYDVRRISVAAAVLYFFADVAVSQAPNIVILLLLSVVQGVGFGCLLVCPMSLIGYYFKKRRALASSISSSGFCIAYLVFPIITEYLRIQFGLRGALLMIAGIKFHLVAINMLLRPVESYTRRKPLETKQQPPGDEKLNNCTHTDDKTTHIHTEDMSGDSTRLVSDILCTEDNSKSVVLKSCNVNKEDDRNGNGMLRLNGECENGRVDVMDHRRSRGDSVCKSSDMLHASNGVHREISFYQSQVSIISKSELPYVVCDDGDEKDDVSDQKSERQAKRSPRKLVDFSLFKLWIFRMLALFAVLSVFGNYMTIYMPAFALTNGLEQTDAALLLTISGLMDLLTRIVSGYLADFKCVSKPKVTAFALLVCALVAQLARFFTTYTLLTVYAVVVGIFGGFRQNFRYAILIDYVGVERSARGYALCTMLMALTISVNHPIIGAILDKTGNFIVSLHYIGTVLFLAAFLILCEPIFLGLDARKKAKEKEEMDVQTSVL